MEFGIATNTSIPNLLMPSAGPPKKPMELDNVATRPAEPNTVPKASIVSLGEPAVHADPLPTTGSVPTPPEKLTITTSTSIPNPLTPSAGCPPEKLMELDIANAGPVSEPLPFTAGLPETIVTAQPVRLEGQPNIFRFGQTQAGTRRKRDGDRRLHRQETEVS